MKYNNIWIYMSVKHIFRFKNKIDLFKWNGVLKMISVKANIKYKLYHNLINVFRASKLMCHNSIWWNQKISRLNRQLNINYK